MRLLSRCCRFLSIRYLGLGPRNNLTSTLKNNFSCNTLTVWKRKEKMLLSCQILGYLSIRIVQF